MYYLKNLLRKKVKVTDSLTGQRDRFKDLFPPEIFPENITLWLDLGFTGVDKDYPDASVRMPKKKPRGKELTDKEKAQNKVISSLRVLVEHAIGGIKRLRITSDKFRNKKDEFNDEAMLISCGLWNYHLKCGRIGSSPRENLGGA